MEREYHNEIGLWQPVQPDEMQKATDLVKGELQLLTVNDYYKGQKIINIILVSVCPPGIREKIGTDAAVLFMLERNFGTQ